MIGIQSDVQNSLIAMLMCNAWLVVVPHKQYLILLPLCRRTVVSSQLMQVSGLAVLKDFLYWIDKDQQLIERVDKNTGLTREAVMSKVSHLTDLVAITDIVSSKCCYQRLLLISFLLLLKIVLT